MLFVPWLNTTNTWPGLEFIKRTKCTVVIGHLEIAGFQFENVGTAPQAGRLSTRLMRVRAESLHKFHITHLTMVRCVVKPFPR